MKFKLLIILKFLICLPQFSNEQVISFSMRKIAYSTNQFGLDLLRASKNDKNDNKLVFCPFCISSSLVMLLMGSQKEMANSLRHALYLYGMSENEINLAYYDMMNHLGVNLGLPTQKQSSIVTTNLNYKTPGSGGVSGSSGSNDAFNHNNNNLINKANLLSSESQTLTLINPNSNSYLNSVQSPLDSFGQRLDNFKNSFDINNNQLFQSPSSYDYLDRNKILHPFSPYNEHRNNFIKFSTANSIDDPLSAAALLNSDLNTDIKTSNYLFGRFADKRRTGRAFGFGKNGFWNSKSYLNPFNNMFNVFQNNMQTQFATPSNYPLNYHQNGIHQPDIAIEKFGQNVNHQALNNIKLPNNFHYYNKHMSSSRPTIAATTTTTSPTQSNQDNQRNLTTASNLASSTILNRKQSTISSPSTESPSKHYSTITHDFNHPHSHHHKNHHFNYHHFNTMKEHPPTSLDNSILNHHTIRLGNTNADLSSNDIAFLSNIYVQRDFVINYHYHVLLQKFYKTAIHPLDFIHNGEETRQHINAIVQMQTDNKICNILSERQLPSTQLLLVSALYFKGELDLKLNLTKGKSSFTSDNNINNIYHHQHNATANSSRSKEQLGRDPTENLDNQFAEEIWMEASRTRLRYAFDKYLNASTIEMPFKDSMITLVIMIPNDKNGLDTLLTKLNAQMLNDVINSLEIRRITIKLPKIDIENSFSNLSMALANLGLSDLFRPGHSQLTNISDFKWLYVSNILHKTHLNIKESSVNNQQIIASKQRSKQDETDVINIELNKPFLFFIIDSVSGLIMSMGKMDKQNLEENAYRLPNHF